MRTLILLALFILVILLGSKRTKKPNKPKLSDDTKLNFDRHITTHSYVNTITQEPDESIETETTPNKEDALTALLSLGYKKKEAEIAIIKAINTLGNNYTQEDIIKQALKFLK